jgi:hypothetical protein
LRSRLPAAHPAPEDLKEASPVAIINETVCGVVSEGVVSITAVPVVRAFQGTRVLVSVSGAHVAKPSVVRWSQQLRQLPLLAPCTALVSQAGVGSEAEAALQALTIQDRGYAAVLGGFESTAGATSEFGKTSTNGMNPIDPRDFRTSSPPG